MPKVTIWIRKEDEAKWQAIANKPEWLHLVIDNLYNQPYLRLGAELSKENKKLDYLKKHPEKAPGLTGLDFLDDPTYTDMEDTP